MDFGRVVTAMVTPFDQHLKIDWTQTAKLIDFLIEEQQSDSLVICGTTGESPTLNDEEKLEMFAFAVKQAKGRCKIIAGTGSYDTAHTIHLTQKAEQLGVDGVLLVAPYYNRPSQEGLYQHFKSVAEQTKLPIMLYNIPGRTGINISADTIVRLAEIPNIEAVKESSSDLDQMSKIIAHTDSSFKLYSGDDNLTLPILSIGGYGIVSVASHVAGKEIQQLIKAYVEGKPQEAAKWHHQLYPVFKGMFECPERVPNPAPVKYALKHLGLDVGGVRLPLVDVTEKEAAFIRGLFA